MGIIRAVKKVRRVSFGFGPVFNPKLCPGFSFPLVCSNSSRSYRILVSDSKPSPSTAESRETTAKAAAGLKVCHDHQRNRSQTSVSRHSIPHLRKITPTPPRHRKCRGFGYHYEELRFLNESGNARVSFFPLSRRAKDPFADRRAEGMHTLFCGFGRLTRSFSRFSMCATAWKSFG